MSQFPVKTKRGRAAVSDSQKIFNEGAIRYNLGVIDYCRTSMSALSGGAAGILGLTALQGFIFYFISAFSLSIMLLVFKAGLKTWDQYFLSRSPVLTGGLMNQLFTFLLCWTFLYGMVHVY